MEIEESRSQFIDFDESLALIGDNLNTPENQLFKFKLFDGSRNQFLKIGAILYKFIDSLFNTKSYTFSAKTYDGFSHYEDLILYLKNAGIIKTAGISYERFNDSPRLFHAYLRGDYPPGITDGNINLIIHGSSFGLEPKEVLSKTLGEFLERYFLTIYHNKKFLHSSIESLEKGGIRHLDINHLHNFSEKQKNDYPRRRWNEKNFFRWTRGHRVLTGESVLLPAQLVYWSYILNNDPEEPFLAEKNTNGCGGMFSEEEAILSGLYELVQRDAFLIYWLNKLTPPKINPASVLDERFQKIYNDSIRYGYEIYCLDVTLDTGIPSFIAMIIDRSGVGPFLSTGGGCEANPGKALRQALQEAWAVNNSRRILPNFNNKNSDKILKTGSIGLKERLELWSDQKMSGELDFFIRGDTKNFSEISFKRRQKFYSAKEELNYMVKLIESIGAGYEVYAHINEHKILKNLGFFSARVIIPGFVQFYLREENMPLAAKRLKNAPIKIGLEPADNLNLLPHPFP